MSTVWDLNRLRYAIRKITGKFDTNQLPDITNGEPTLTNNPPVICGIDDYINDYYLFDLPESLRSLRLKGFYNFTTVPNCGTYSVPQNIYQLEPPIYVDNYQFAWYQWPDVFYRIWPELDFIDRNLFHPDGLTNSFTFTLTQTPVQQGTVVIGLQPNIDGVPSPFLETFTDQDQPIPLDIPFQQGFVNPAPLTGNLGGTGTVDYLTGFVTVNYITAPPIGTTSSCHYHPYVASRSRDILFFQQQLFLRPIPNDTYSVKVMAYFMPTTVMNAATNATVRPSEFVNGANDVNIQGFSGKTGLAPPNDVTPATDMPQFAEWWQMIAYGASLKILIEDGAHDEYQKYRGYYEESMLLAQRKCLKQLANQRIQTNYSTQVGGPSWPVYPLY